MKVPRHAGWYLKLRTVATRSLVGFSCEQIDDAQIVAIHLQAYPYLSSRNAR